MSYNEKSSTQDEKCLTAVTLRDLNQFTGTSQWYRHWGELIYTDGILFLMEHWECHWLIDIVASVIPTLKKRMDSDFYLVKFQAQTNGGGIFQVEDGNDYIIYQQKISYTDFRDKDVWVRLFLELTDADGTYCLLVPTEH